MTVQDSHLDTSALIGMVAMGVTVFVVANDFTALSVALPAIEKTFSTGVNTSQWVINGHAMVFGVAIVTGGRLADMFGRRRILLIGAAIFAAFSVLGGFAPNIWLLLACRFIMGIGGTMMWPAILGMTFSLLPKSKAGLASGLIEEVGLRAGEAVVCREANVPGHGPYLLVRHGTGLSIAEIEEMLRAKGRM